MRLHASLISSTCLHDDVDSMDDAGDVSENGEQDIDEDICAYRWLTDRHANPLHNTLIWL